ncbi:hypothetical protein LBMAG46_36030 [Planctomycetia bacterium]|nr:hypothetical protein LBMAG46_36030 [Planctomycetia bacterium]
MPRDTATHGICILLRVCRIRVECKRRAPRMRLQKEQASGEMATAPGNAEERIRRIRQSRRIVTGRGGSMRD